MSNRWCIVAGARSGSTWLEEMIYKSFPVRDYNIKLGEPLEHVNSYANSSGHNHAPALNPDGFIELRRLENITFKDQTGYVDYLIDTFNNGNSLQDIVLKVFPQDWKLPKEEYTKFLCALNHLDFKFINLDRASVDRAISWQIMQERKVVHRWTQEDSKFFSTLVGNTHITEPEPNSIVLDVNTFYNYMNLTLSEDTVKDEILKNFKHVDVHYNTLIDDCNRNNIPIDQETTVQKLYVNEYKKLISNYGEIVDETNKLEFIETYGKDSRLTNSMADTI